jgi:hypothetical protein
MEGFDDAESEHRFMQDVLQLMKYLDPLKDNPSVWTP